MSTEWTALIRAFTTAVAEAVAILLVAGFAFAVIAYLAVGLVMAVAR